MQRVRLFCGLVLELKLNGKLAQISSYHQVSAWSCLKSTWAVVKTKCNILAT